MDATSSHPRPALWEEVRPRARQEGNYQKWFISFAHLGRGDTGRAIASTPVLLLVQLLALPVYLWLFLGSDLVEAALSTHLLTAFAGLIRAPLVLAWITERLTVRRPRAKAMVERLGLLPVPLLAMVVFVIATSQVATISGLTGVLTQVALIFVAYLVAAAFLGKWIGRLFGLRDQPTRTLAFSFGARNSFVMLPIALALPEAWQAAVVVIVFQSLIELFGMAAYLHWVPNRLIPDATDQ